MLKKITGIICVISMIMSVLCVGVGAAEPENSPRANIVVSINEKSGFVDVEIAVKNAKFLVMQPVFRYNKEVILPVDADGNEAGGFLEFAKMDERAKFLSTVGRDLDEEKGLFEFVLFVSPGTQDEFVNENGEANIGDEALSVYKLRFKRIGEGDFGIEIAVKDAKKAYNEILPEGVGIMDLAGNKLIADVTMIENGEEKETISFAPPEEKQEVEKPEEGDVEDGKTPVVDVPVDEEEIGESQDKPIVNIPAENELTSAERKKDVICLKVGKSMTVAYGKKKLIDSENKLVVPYIKNDRTMVPIRFISEALGAEVLWEEGWSGCVIKKGSKEIKLEFGSADFLVNGERFSFEAPVELVYDRTMVPLRFVSEQLECDVYWEPINSAVVISPKGNPWMAERKAEINAINEMLLSILNIL